WKVTPNPLTGARYGSRNLSTCDLPGGGVLFEGTVDVDADAAVVRQVERRHREGALAKGRVPAGLGFAGLLGGLVSGRPLLRGAFPHRRQDHNEHDDEPEHDVGGL